MYSDLIVSIDESLKEDYEEVVEIEVPEAEAPVVLDTPQRGPETPQEVGESSLLLDAIAATAQNIDNYNVIKVNMTDPDMVKVMEDIADMENYKLGKLQSLLKMVSPNAESIMNGAVEAEEQAAQDAPDIQLESLNESTIKDWHDINADHKIVQDCYRKVEQALSDIFVNYMTDLSPEEFNHIAYWNLLNRGFKVNESLKEDWKDGELTKQDLSDWDWEMANTTYRVERSIKRMLDKHPEYRDEILSTAKNCRNILTNLCSFYNESLDESRAQTAYSYIRDYLKHHPFDNAEEMIEYFEENDEIDELEDMFQTDIRAEIEDYFDDESLNESSDMDIERVSDKLDSIIDAAKDAKDKFDNGTKNDLSLESCLGSLRSIERNLDTLKKLVSGFHGEAIKTRNKEFDDEFDESLDVDIEINTDEDEEIDDEFGTDANGWEHW